jgi:hypothetical protein
VAEWIETELEDRSALLNAVDSADRKAVRARDAVDALLSRANLNSATEAAASFRDRAEALVKRMAESGVASVRVGAAAAFGRLLELSPPAWRIELVCRWALSDHLTERTTVARALSLPTPVFVADLAISELSRDPSPLVRTAVVRAVGSHFRSDPETFARIARDLMNDTEPPVRTAAREQLSGLVAVPV